MKHTIRRMSASVLSLCLMGSVTAGLTASAAGTEDTRIGAFCQSAVKEDQKDFGIEYYTYSDAYFANSAAQYQPCLATASAYLAMASANSPRTDETHAPDRDIRSFLKQLGFTNIETNADYAVVPTMDTLGVACAMKTVTDAEGKSRTLLVIVPRSSGYGAEWGSNFRIGKEGNAAGFASASQKMLDFLKSYAQKHDLTGDLKIWLSGYSRGGAVVNLTAASLIDDPAAVFGTQAALAPDQIFAYTFEAPMAADSANDPRNARYQHIYNVLSRDDLIPRLAPAKFGFDRYGTDHVVEETASQAEMLDQLGQINPLLYGGYLFYGYSAADFKKRQLGMAVDGSTGTYPEDTTDANRLPGTQEAFTQLIADSMANAALDRADYAEHVEPYFSELASVLIPAFLGDGQEELSAAASQSRYGTSLLVYLYMDYELSRIPYVLEEYADQPEQAELFFNKTNRLAMMLRVMAGGLSAEETAQMQAFIADLKPDEQAWIRDVFGDFSPEALEEAKQKTGIADFNLSEECIADMKSLYTMYGTFMQPVETPEGGVRYQSYTQEHYEQEQAFVKERLAVCYQGFMKEFLTACGLPEEMVAHQTEEAACRTMPAVLESILLNSTDRSDIYAQDIEDAESVGKLATILGNLNNMLYAHSLDTALSWVRAEDPQYENYFRPVRSLTLGYRGVQIQQASETSAAVHGKVYGKDGTLAAEFENGRLLSSTNAWIQLEQGCLHLPLKEAFTVELTAADTAEFALTLEEYSTYAGEALHVYSGDAAQDWSKLTLAAGDTYTLTVPAIEKPALEWAENSGATYSVQKTANPDAPVPTEAPTKAAPEKPFTEEQLCHMASIDFQKKTGIAPAKIEAEANADGKYTVRLTDAAGETLAVYTLDPATGTGQDQAGNAIDLPQTGTRSPLPLLAVCGSLAAIAEGLWLMKRSR